MSNNWKKTIKFAKTVTSNNQIRQYGTVRKGQIYHFRIHRLCHSLDPIYRNADCCQQIQSGYFCKADCLCMQQPFRLAALLLLLDSHLRRIRNLQNQVRQERNDCRSHRGAGRTVTKYTWRSHICAWTYISPWACTRIIPDKRRDTYPNTTDRAYYRPGSSRKEPCQLRKQRATGKGRAHPHGHGVLPLLPASHCRPRNREPHLYWGGQMDES